MRIIQARTVLSILSYFTQVAASDHSAASSSSVALSRGRMTGIHDRDVCRAIIYHDNRVSE